MAVLGGMAATSLFSDLFLTTRAGALTGSETIEIGGWRAVRSDGRIWRGSESRPLEPKVMDLLFVLASRPNHVFSREALMHALWPDTTVGEDALFRCVFKLRKALGDPSRVGLVQTIPKRGYRLRIADGNAEKVGAASAPRRGAGRLTIGLCIGTAALALAVMSFQLADRAHTPKNLALVRAADAYYQFTRADNDAAIILYERALETNPDSPEALAGLASALVQNRLRWPDGRDAPRPAGSALRAALASGRLADSSAAPDLRRALELVVRAARARPQDPEIQRAFGLTLSANGRLKEAAGIYDRALARHPDDWALLINRADIFDIEGRPEEALPLLERAYESMSRAYRENPAKVRPWQGELGIELGRRYEARLDLTSARRWYRRTATDDPSAARALERLTVLARR